MEKGKDKYLIGDLNFDYWNDTASQKQLRQIKSLVVDNVVAEGWSQVVKDNTRYQNASKSCLDHIYLRSTGNLKTVINQNQTGYDHNCVGVVLNVGKQLTHPQVTQYRDVAGINLDDFAYVFNNLDLAGIHLSQDVDEAVTMANWVHKTQW